MKRQRGRAYLVIAALLVLGLAVAGCSLLDEPPTGTVSIGEQNNGKMVEVSREGELVVELASNPSTGYDWYLEGSLPSQLTTISDEFEPEGDAGVVGAGGMRVITYGAVTPGTGPLTLVYKRAWETGVAPEKTFTVTVVIPEP